MSGNDQITKYELQRKEALERADSEYYNIRGPHYRDNERYAWAVKAINKSIDELIAPFMNQNVLKDTILMHVQESIMRVTEVDGDIEKVVTMGNSVIIKFENGNVYEQSLISKKERAEVTHG